MKVPGGKIACLGQITPKINQKQWKASHQYIYLENRVFSTWRKVRVEGTFSSWQMAVRFVVLNEDVNRDQCQLFFIYLGQFSISLQERF